MPQSLKALAIRLRKQGKTYSEILKEIPVAKSTLALWLRSVGLSKRQIQRITAKRLQGALRGSQARRSKRKAEVLSLITSGVTDVGALTERELWLIGITLYWAEGSKQYEHFPSGGLIFTNSDSAMIRVYLNFLANLEIRADSIRFELYTHQDRKSDVEEFKRWWARQLRISKTRITKVYFKQGNRNTKRKHVGDLYHGQMRIKVRASTVLNRRISGWIAGIVASVGSGVTGNTSAFEAEDSRIVP